MVSIAENKHMFISLQSIEVSLYKVNMLINQEAGMGVEVIQYVGFDRSVTIKASSSLLHLSYSNLS